MSMLPKSASVNFSLGQLAETTGTNVFSVVTFINKHWRIKGGARDACAPPRSEFCSCSFRQTFAKQQVNTSTLGVSTRLRKILDLPLMKAHVLKAPYRVHPSLRDKDTPSSTAPFSNQKRSQIRHLQSANNPNVLTYQKPGNCIRNYRLFLQLRSSLSNF